MNKVDEFFYKTDKVSFIEINNNSYQALRADLAYPVDTENLVSGLTEGHFYNELSYKHIVDGIIMILAIDNNFIYKEEYMKSLGDIVGDVTAYVEKKAQDLAEEDPFKEILYYRFLYLNDLSSPYSEYKYASSIYRLGEKEEKDFLMDEGHKILEGLLTKDPDFPLTYYELGLISSKEGQNNKALIYFQKALEKVDDSLAREELRELIRIVRPKALIERGITDLNSNRLERAMEEFKESKKLEDTALANYYIARVDEIVGNMDQAIDSYRHGLELSTAYKEIYQDLAIAYYRINEPIEALAVLNEGLKHHEEDIGLLYNRMVIYISLDLIAKAKEDFNTLTQYGDLSQDIYDNLALIKEEFNF